MIIEGAEMFATFMFLNTVTVAMNEKRSLKLKRGQNHVLSCLPERIQHTYSASNQNHLPPSLTDIGYLICSRHLFQHIKVPENSFCGVVPGCGRTIELPWTPATGNSPHRWSIKHSPDGWQDQQYVCLNHISPPDKSLTQYSPSECISYLDSAARDEDVLLIYVKVDMRDGGEVGCAPLVKVSNELKGQVGQLMTVGG